MAGDATSRRPVESQIGAGGMTLTGPPANEMSSHS